MRELELDGIHDDGEHVILIDSDGDRYTLRITEALRAAVRRDRPALGALQAASSAPLRPREIQAMLRAGRSAEEIAQVAEVAVEHVRRYEGPVLAERAWIAQRARSFHVGRGGPALGEVVAERLRARQAGEDTAWDAWRRPDGTWTLELTFSAAERTRQAHWVVDMDAQSVTADDDEARWITDEDAPRHPYKARARLTAITSSVYDQEAESSTASTSRPSSAAAHPAALDEDALDALNARRGLRPVPTFDTAPVWASLDEDPTPSTPASGPSSPREADELAAAEHAAAIDEELPSDGEELPEAGATEDDRVDSEATGGEEQPAQEETDHEETLRTSETIDLTPLPGFDEPSQRSTAEERNGSTAQPAESTEQKRPARRSAKKSGSGRKSMPSWDEIVFGSKHD